MKYQRKVIKKTNEKSKSSKITDPVQVFCRVRPIFDESVKECVEIIDDNTIKITSSENSNAMRNGGPIRETTYNFQSVMDKSSQQDEVFKLVSLPLVEDVLRGKNALLFTYGVTSSGKTHTMTGSRNDQGIVPRSLDVIFNSISQMQAKRFVFKPNKSNRFNIQSELDAIYERQRITPPATPSVSSCEPDETSVTGLVEDNSYSVFVSFIEIYNNYIYDLLEGNSYDNLIGINKPPSKYLREDSRRNMYVSGVTEIEVTTSSEALTIINRGQKKRKVAHTKLNADSSRSHSVFNIRIVQAPLDATGEEVLKDKNSIVISQLSLVDLAGSERTMRTGNYGERLREAGNINQSLMVLRNCIEALRDNQCGSITKLVPYRDSKITHLFKNFFEGEGKVRMIVCVNPNADEYDETIQVMRFAEVTQEVQITRSREPVVNDYLVAGRRKAKHSRKIIALDPEGVVTYSWPPFPSTETIDNESPESVIVRLMDYLKERETRREFMLTQQDVAENDVRDRIIEMETEGVRLRKREKELESMVKNVNTECSKAYKKIKDLERAYSMLQRTASVYETDRLQMEKQLDERDFKIILEKSEKNKLKQDYNAKLALTTQTFNRQIETTRKKAEVENSENLMKNQRKMDQLKNILINDTTSIDSSNKFVTPCKPIRTRAGQTRTALQSYTGGARDVDPSTLYGGGKPSTVMANKLRKVMQTAPVRGSDRVVSRINRARSPPPLKPKPMTNVKHHRRSRSADTWIEHRPKGTVKTDMLLQPCMVKKKSVTNLRAKDVKGSSKYVLTHQGLDTDGEIVTQLIKGSVCQTTGGGTAVIYNDVETCKQTSPVDKNKRKRVPELTAQDFEGEWTDIETRCKIAIEGHNLRKRSKGSR